MTDRPIIFSAPMVRALLDGRKTQTRRLASSPLRKCEAGDRLWVRETFRLDCAYDGLKPTKVAENAAVWWRVDGSKVGDGIPGKTRVSIHMPRWPSRLTLIVEAVRVESLQAISEADAKAEGIRRIGAEYGAGTKPTSFDDGPNLYTADVEGWAINAPTATETYRLLWEWLHGANSWNANPEVVVLTFRVVRGNIDRSEG